MLFTTMAIPLKYQHRVLFWGIFGALALRAVFILVGTALITRFWWLLLVFGVFLVYTGLKIIRHRADEGATEATRGLGSAASASCRCPTSSTGSKFFTRINARRAATPLLAALFVIEVTDVIFAVDSVPAILAVSNEPFLVFASNAFAILGLRAMYFLLANAKERFHYLSHALGGILVFVGLKMTVSHWYHLNTYVSLGGHPGRPVRSDRLQPATHEPSRDRSSHALTGLHTVQGDTPVARSAGARSHGHRHHRGPSGAERHRR